jgi:hypothetical protein
MMMDGGNGDCCRIESEIGGDKFVHRRKNRNRVLGSGFGGSGRIRFDCRDKSYAQPRRFQLTIDAEVVAAEGAGSGNGDAQDGADCYCPAPCGPVPAFSCVGCLPSTALRQRP